MLPKQKSKIESRLSRYSILLQGEPKVGKTTFASNSDNPIFLSTENGTKHLEVYKVEINSWADFLSTCRELKESEHDFKTVVIDTIDNAYRLCSNSVCSKLRISHPSEMPHGKAYGRIKEEFWRVLSKLENSDLGLILISHIKSVEVKPKTGEPYHEKRSSLSNSVSDMINGLMDFIFECDYKTFEDENGKSRYKRILRLSGDTRCYNGGRFVKEPPKEIPLDFKIFQDIFSKTII